MSRYVFGEGKLISVELNEWNGEGKLISVKLNEWNGARCR